MDTDDYPPSTAGGGSSSSRRRRHHGGRNRSREAALPNSSRRQAKNRNNHNRSHNHQSNDTSATTNMSRDSRYTTSTSNRRPPQSSSSRREYKLRNDNDIYNESSTSMSKYYSRNHPKNRQSDNTSHRSSGGSSSRARDNKDVDNFYRSGDSSRADHSHRSDSSREERRRHKQQIPKSVRDCKPSRSSRRHRDDRQKPSSSRRERERERERHTQHDDSIMDESIDIKSDEDSFAGNSQISHSSDDHSADISQSNNTSHSESTIEIVYPDSESTHSKHKSLNNTYDDEDSFAGNDDLLSNSNRSSEEEFVISEEEIDGENSLNDSEFDEDIEIADYSQRGGYTAEEESELELLGLRRRGNNGSTRYSQLYNNEEELGISRLDSQGTSTSIYDATNKNDLELNPNYGKISKADELREQIADLPLITTSTADSTTTPASVDVHDGAYDLNSGSLDDETKLEDFVLDHDKAVVSTHTDPPIQDTSEHNLDPDDENRSLFSRLDCPPSPAGPEKNKVKGYQRQSSKGSSKGSSSKGNSKGDSDNGRELALVEDEVSKISIRGQDPPESGRGCDPKPKGSSEPHSSRKHRSGGSKSSGDRKSSRSKGSSHKSRSSRDESRRKDKKKKQPEIKGILKKKGAPIPITQFGKPLTPTQDDSDEDSFAGNSSNSSGSDPDISECKQTTVASISTTTLQLGSSAPPNVDDDTTIKSVGTAKSGGLRSGKYATVNQMAAWKQGEDNDSDDEEGDYTYTGVSELTPYSGTDFNEHSDFEGNYKYDASGKPIKRHSSDGNDDDGSTLQSIATNTNTHFDRSKSHFLRTADLGLTQDTIFAQQFLDDANQKVEPHYHIPSLHPPPGVQFHIDENWVCLDDGKGSHSPIAPQAVDALVAMGYRAACDPMMWTPTSKTRKYMTEKKLRFDDMPVPGPLDEGDGSVDDTTGVGVWSGKFPHKYHGHEQPAIRSQGIVNMSPEELVDLLMDSSRVSEYNKSSIGRVDEVVLSDGTNLDSCPFSGQRKKKLTGVVVQGAKVVNGTAVFDSETDDEGSDEEIEETIFDEHGTKSVRMIPATSSKKEQRQSHFVGVTKLVRTTNKPPLVRKVLEFFTLLHCRALTDDQGGDGYIIVGRGIIPAADADSDKKGVMHSEILLNVHIIRRLRPVSSSKKSRDKKSKGGSRSRSVSDSGRKASKSDLANRCLLINVNHLKSPLVPNMLAKKVGLSAAVNFITDIRALTE